ncbi:hypothetical protein LIER_26696 [Lithospermum erythrorhizon]|uniref:Uncharacterized protein n=1 Tax=Lithospermum erythrorhizon TaxID=34254 RepID=A0AAV3R9B3_LITER
MEEDETITSYCTRINDMANEAFELREPMTNEKQIQSLTKDIKMMNSSTEILDEILEKGKKGTSNSRIGCTTREEKKKSHVNTRWVASSSQQGRRFPNLTRKTMSNQQQSENTERKHMWKEKVIFLHIATRFMATEWEGWYFDSGCSRHMTGNKSSLT